MVMMEKPSPIQVGREFVRQYYTLLNKAPELLYRFYGVSSSYVHGGRYCDGEPEQPVIGQNEIHKKIDSLKFCDCHTKIRQVDAHSTIGSGVVVQVTGELSNSGQPLRRFMQTFVLAPQGDNPYKFYVHNDIFRYQDEVFNEDTPAEHSDDEEPELDEGVDTKPTSGVTQMSDYQEDFYVNEAPVHIDSETQSHVITNGIEQQLEATNLNQQETPSSPPTEIPVRPATPPRTPSPNVQPEPVDVVYSEPKPSEESSIETDLFVEGVETEEPKSTPKVFSWADLASKNTPASRASTQQGTVVRVNKTPPEIQTDTTEQAATRPPRGPRGQRSYPRDDDRGGFGERPEPGRRPGGGPGRDGGTRYADNQQIFVGNLPYDIVENDLRDHFADFGPVLEVKINHSHSNNPSFGFIIFEDPKSVEGVLNVMPTQYKNNHRINIEEKKQRSSRDNNRRTGDARRGGMGDSRGGRRMPPSMRRDRQGSREGQRSNYNNGPRR